MNKKFTKKSPFSLNKKQPKAARLDKSSITKLIKSSIEKRIEKKFFTDYATNFSIVSAASSTPTYRSLLPLVAQGAAKSQRIGNEIHVKKAILNVAVNLLPSQSTTNNTTMPCYVKIWILKYKLENTTNFNSTVSASNFFETNNSSVPFQGSMLDVLLDVDSDLFEVVATRMCKLGTTSYYSAGLTTFPGYLDNSPMSKTFSIDVTKGFPKTIKYNDNASTTPTNCNLFVVWQAVSCSGVSVSGQSMAEYHIGYRVEYTDL